jgi:hypothetical protein
LHLGQLLLVHLRVSGIDGELGRLAHGGELIPGRLSAPRLRYVTCHSGNFAMLALPFRSIIAGLLLVGCASGCAAGPAPKPTVAPAPVSPAPVPERTDPSLDAPEPVVDKPKRLPESCADPSAEICTPPPDFVSRLCRSTHPDIALTMFHKSSPWKRAYVNGNREAWYTEARSRPQQLRHSEEVLIVTDRGAASGGVRVSGSGSYDVLRFNGSCVSLMSDEVSMNPRGAVGQAVIPWRKLDPTIRHELLRDEKIAHRAERRRESCKQDRESPRCNHADRGLSELIARYLRLGGDIPPPRRVP